MSRTNQADTVRLKYQDLAPLLNERPRRCWAATDARTIGYGGISLVAHVTGLSRNTISAGVEDLSASGAKTPPSRSRREGGGRKKLSQKDTTLIDDLHLLIEPTTRGDPESPLRWTCTSTANLTEALRKRGHPICTRSVCTLLRTQNYSLQSHRKTREGTNHPDRDRQFRHISASAKRLQTKNQPMLSVDTKKKELIGNVRTNGTEWRPKGNPVQVNRHDFPDQALGKVIPYGVDALAANQGWVHVGIDHDTAAVAVESIRQWWIRLGRERYPAAKELLITADCGGSTANRSRLWKIELQTLADETRLTIHVHHFPPGTSTWNKIEHKLFAFISRNWKGRPLTTRATVVNLMANTNTKTGVSVQAILETNTYAIGRQGSDGDMDALNLKQESFHGEWNYRVEPRAV